MDTQQHEEGDALTGDLIPGAAKIKTYLISLGLPATTDPYYLRKHGWPIGKMGNSQSNTLIASKSRLARHAQKLAAARRTEPEPTP